MRAAFPNLLSIWLATISKVCFDPVYLVGGRSNISLIVFIVILLLQLGIVVQAEGICSFNLYPDTFQVVMH